MAGTKIFLNMRNKTFPAKLLIFFKIIIPVLLFILAGLAIHSALIEFESVDLIRKFHETPLWKIGLSLLFAIAAYFFSWGYDRAASETIGNRLSFRKNGLLSTISYGIGNSTGFSSLGTSSVRYHLYSSWGYSFTDITRIIVYTTIFFWMGFLFLGIFLFPSVKIPVEGKTGFFLKLWPLSVFFAGIMISYFSVSLFRRKPIKIKSKSLEIPSFGVSLGQLVCSVLDWFFSCLALYIFFPQITVSGFIDFFGFFLFSQLIGLISNIPGGLGVFEAVIIIFAKYHGIDPAATVSNLILFRITYYFIPLCTGSLLLILYEIRIRKEIVYKTVSDIGTPFLKIVPEISAVVIFLIGGLLVITGTLPASHDRLKALNIFVPVVVIESSHFFASLVGTAMLFVSNGLRRRIKTSWRITVFLLISGCIFSILKGFDIEQVIIIIAFLSILLAGRKEFYRLEKVSDPSIQAEQVVLTAVVIIFSVWLGFFNYKHIEYSRELWWKFALFEHAPRFLRGEAGVICLVILLGILRISHPVLKNRDPAGGGKTEDIYEIVRKSPDSYSFLALTGDKKYLFSKTGNSFLMYGINKKTWVSMGSPVGDENEKTELIWEFLELADKNNCRAAFYHVNKSSLEFYLDAGLSFFKIGEEARVNLNGFLLDIPERKHIRYSYRRGIKTGLVFEIIFPPFGKIFIDSLKEISEKWLNDKKVKEKGFSLGFFSEEYIKFCPCAVIKKDDKILAFSNLWLPENREEFSIDLMRFTSDSPQGIMEFLFTSLLLWGSEKGYKYFNFGAAPLSGLADRPAASSWNKIGSFIYRHGEHFYNFEGLRKFKEKFNPEWQGKYIVCRSGLNVPFIITDITTLISRGKSEI